MYQLQRLRCARSLLLPLFRDPVSNAKPAGDMGVGVISGLGRGINELFDLRECHVAVICSYGRKRTSWRTRLQGGHSLLDEWILICGCFWRNETTAKLYSPAISRWCSFTRLRSSQEGGTQSDRRAEVNYIQTDRQTDIPILNPICKSAVNDYACRPIQSNTQQKGYLQTWRRTASNFMKRRSRLCVFLHFYFLTMRQIFTKLGMRGATTPAYFVISCNL